MLTDKLILALSIALCVILVWVIEAQYPTYFSQGSLFAQIATAIILGVGILIYWKMTNPVKRCTSPNKGGDAGSCELDTDCNAPHGHCYKDLNNNCACACKPGWFGPNCASNTVEWNSPNCMGPNTQWSPRNKSGVCVCPNDNWASGIDPSIPNGGYVQCLKCAGEGADQWGPLAGDSPCSAKWTTKSLLSNNCVVASSTSPGCKDIWAQYSTYKGPGGESPSIVMGPVCGGNITACPCATGADSRAICNMKAWIDPSVLSTPTCQSTEPGLNKERNCSGFQCFPK